MKKQALQTQPAVNACMFGDKRLSSLESFFETGFIIMFGKATFTVKALENISTHESQGVFCYKHLKRLQRAYSET